MRIKRRGSLLKYCMSVGVVCNSHSSIAVVIAVVTVLPVTV